MSTTRTGSDSCSPTWRSTAAACRSSMRSPIGSLLPSSATRGASISGRFGRRAGDPADPASVVAVTPAEAEATLLRNGVDPRFIGSRRDSFLQAFKNGELALAEAFIVSGMPVRAEGNREPPIVKAAEGGRLDAVELAMRYGA